MLQLKLSIVIWIFILQSFDMKPIRTIRVMVSQSKPFAFYENRSFKGLEVDIVENFAKRHNTKIKYIATEESLREVFSSEEHFGNFSQSTAFSEIDIFIGALEANLITKEHLIASRSYYHDILTWCVQQSRPIPVWKNIFYLCNDPLVYAILTLIAVILCSLAYFCQQFERFRPKWDWNKFAFNGFCCFLGFPCCYNPTTTSNRLGYSGCLLGGIVFVCALSSILIEFFITPILDPQIKSVQEIVDGNFKLVGDRFAVQKISQQTEIYPTMDNFEVTPNPHEYFNELRWNTKLAIAISRELSFARNETAISYFVSLDNAYCFDYPNIIHEYSLSVLTRKMFPLLNELNKFIERAIEGGLIVKWLKRYQSFGKEKSRTQFTISEFESFFVSLSLYLCLMSSSFLAFIIERFIYEKVRTPKSKPFWRYVEMAIDPYRYFFLEDLDWSK